MEETTKAYIAGLIDGEGSIFINIVKQHYHFRPQLSIMMTDKKTIEYLISKIKFCRYSEADRGIWKRQYGLIINRMSDIITILELVFPYLVTKKEQAKIMLEFCSYKHNKNTADKDISLMLKIKELNG